MAHADWSIIGLGTSSGDSSRALDINDSGQVVGDYFSSTSSLHHAFITGPNGIGMTDLGALGGAYYSSASGINDSGQVVGTFSMDTMSSHAFFTGPNGIGMTELGGLNFDSTYFGTSINNSGQVLGVIGGGALRAFITGPNGIGMTDLGTLGGLTTEAYDINDSGQVVGISNIERDSGIMHAFITGPNGIGMTDLDALGMNFVISYFRYYGMGINNSGQVAGSCFSHACITDPNGVGMTDLGTLGGYNSYALDINDSGEVVGYATTANKESHAFIYSHGGITDLSLLAPVVAAGWTEFYDDLSINNNGQIAGSGRHNGNLEAFLLSYTPDTVFDPKPIYIPPVPEPEIYLMLLSGLGLIGYLAWRRKETTI